MIIETNRKLFSVQRFGCFYFSDQHENIYRESVKCSRQLWMRSSLNSSFHFLATCRRSSRLFVRHLPRLSNSRSILAAHDPNLMQKLRVSGYFGHLGGIEVPVALMDLVSRFHYCLYQVTYFLTLRNVMNYSDMSNKHIIDMVRPFFSFRICSRFGSFLFLSRMVSD